MPFLDHLEELRQRLFYCAIAVAVGVVVAVIVFYIPNFDILNVLAEPAIKYLHGRTLVYSHPGELFQLKLDVGFVIAMIVASPVIGYQLWGFVAPAMYANEKKIVIPVIAGIVALFITGVVLAFMLILPLTLRFFFGIQSDSITPMIDVQEYFGFAIYMCLAFGLAFELPIVLMGITAIGLITPMFLAKWRRFALVGCLIGATFITPDPTSMFVITAPLYALYELSIILSRMVYKWRERRNSDNSDSDNTPPPPRSPRPPDDSDRREPLRLGSSP